ncbi:MAG: hypothetical protein ABSF55_01895 [Candidatus Staskawiczbacteria bacterium]|jgi:hypothetical protein
MISKEGLDKFKQIYKKRFNKDLADDVASEKAKTLLRMVETIYKPMTLEEYEVLQKRRVETGDITAEEADKSIKEARIEQAEYEKRKNKK